MANDFDQFPVYDPIVSRGSEMLSPVWQQFFGTFFQNLIGYLSQYGIKLPPVTTAQRDSIKTPEFGTTLWNSTEKKQQTYTPSGWQNLTQ